MMVLFLCSVSGALAQVRASLSGIRAPTRASLPPGAIDFSFTPAFQLGQSHAPGWNSTHPPDCSGEPCVEVWDNGTAILAINILSEMRARQVLHF